MIKPEQVPLQVIEAFRVALMNDDTSFAEDFCTALKAWPGKDIVGYGPPFYGIDLILPLTTQENEQ